MTATTVTEVGKSSVEVKGQGLIELVSKYNNCKYILQLKDILYIPKNNNDLIDLGKWDRKGWKFKGENGILTLITTNGELVMQGSKVGITSTKWELSYKI